MRLMFCGALALALAACGQGAPPPPAEPAPPPQAQTSATGVAPLTALTEADFATPLNGELGCSFTSGEDVLMVAKGNVDRAARSEALVKANGIVTRLNATAVGGYDGMVEGASFAADALTIEVSAGARGETGNEQVTYNATLTARSGAEVRAYDGNWTCGP